MKTQSAAMAAARASGTTSLAWCWKVVRLDGAVYGFTSTSRDVYFDGVLYEAASGITPSAIASSADLAVDNLEVAGALDSLAITDDDLRAGRWDGAAVEIFEVNYRDLSMGRMLLATGTLGNVKTGRSTFTAELRGLAQALQQQVGSNYTATCQANFGDTRCKVDLAPLRVTGTLTAVANRRTLTDSARTEPADYFGAGLITMTSGDCQGLSMEVRDYAAGVFTLAQPLALNVAPGDTYEAVPGCRKRRDPDCLDRWSNVINFRGFPDVPGNDKIIGAAGRESGS